MVFLEFFSLAEEASSPKGVVLRHRGAYLMSLGGALVWGMNEGLCTCGLFPCFTATVGLTLAALCGTSICLRQVTAKAVYSAIAYQGATHFCAAPVVLKTIASAPPKQTILLLPGVVHVMTAGAAQPLLFLQRYPSMGSASPTLMASQKHMALLLYVLGNLNGTLYL